MLKLVSINIEKDRHTQVVLDFLKQQSPDVICLQEFPEQDFTFFKKELGMEGEFVPMSLLESELFPGHYFSAGLALFSLHPLEFVQTHYYSGDPSSNTPRYQGKVGDETIGMNHALLVATVRKDGLDYTCGTTHFPWSPEGIATTHQHMCLAKLFQILEQFPDIIFCGDMNAPRGGEIFTELANRYIDHIPSSYKTSINGDLHYAGPLQLMVDGLFSTPQYKTQNISLESGVSDHCSIIATIEKIN